MSSNTSDLHSFTKENLDYYLKELAKQFKKTNGSKANAEIILVGGGAMIANYNFRDATTDIDAIIRTNSSMKEAITLVGDKFNLPFGWLNSDFIRTSSYSSKLVQISRYYKTFYNVLDVRTISAEYLVAMKLCSGRKYKHDLSDIVGVLYEHEKRSLPLSFESVEKAVTTLYGGWNSIPADSFTFIKNLYEKNNFEESYLESLESEKVSREDLTNFQQKYPGAITLSTIKDVLDSLQKKK